MKTVILAGGSGTRLFPISREYFPKQFIRFFDSRSLFQKTVERALKHSNPDEIFVVTNTKYKFIVKEQLDELGVECRIMEEPEAKNTLPAVVWAVKDMKDTVCVLPSDHLVEEGGYLKAVRSAEKIADRFLVTFGVKPDRPHTGYGYIKPGEELGDGFKAEKFVEKPDRKTAERLIQEGYLWNSGMFVFSAELFMEECRKYEPEVYNAFLNSSVEDAYKLSPEVSIDYGIMERSNRVAVVPLNAFWSDVGSFDAIYDIWSKDDGQNAVKGEFIGINARNNLVISDRLIAAIGISDSVIVDTKDVLLICSRGETQKVREVVKLLKEREDERAYYHKTIHRPWGSFTILEEGQFYKIKRVTVKPGAKLSLQMHMHRSEHWVVVKGMARVRVGEREFFLRNGESTFVPSGTLHRLENPGLLPLEVIEVSIGEYLGEDDILRFDDEYGRD